MEERVPALNAPAVSVERLPDLPETAIASIIQHVPLRPRLERCALVCKLWAVFAAAVVDVCLSRHERCQQLQAWLVAKGGVVMELSARGVVFGLHKLQLPVLLLTQLRKLHLNNILASSSSCCSSTNASSSGCCSSTNASSSGCCSSSNGSSSGAVTLPQLQELELINCKLTVPLLSQLLSATTLSKLYWEVWQPQLFSSDTFTEQLTEEQAYAFLWQHLQLLPKLAVLKLHVGSITTADIAPLRNLQHLRRLDFIINLKGPWPAEDAGSSPTELLSALLHLTQLQHLQLGSWEMERVSAQPQFGGYQCFSALTASTQLTALVIAGPMDSGVPIPRPAFQHMFSAGRVLPNLKVLHLEGTPFGEPCVQAAQVAMIAATCPALQELKLGPSVTHDGFDTSSLAQLPPGVTEMNLKGLSWTRPAC